MRLSVRDVLLLSGTLAMPLASYWLVFKPQNTRIETAQKGIEHKRAMLEKLRETTKHNEDLQRANEMIRKQIEKIEEKLPAQKELATIVRQVSDEAVAAGMSPPAIELQKPLDALLYMEQPLKVKMTGDATAFYEFLVKLEQLPRLTRIFNMSLKGAKEGNGVVESEFTLSIYFQKSEVTGQ